MALDPGVVMVVVLGLAFVGFVAWAEVRTRRQRRQKASAEARRDVGGVESPPTRKS